MYKIYKYTNLINGKIYIGQTKNTLEYRAQGGRNNKDCTRFYNAILKYGWNNFEPTILKDNIETVEDANYFEDYYICLFDSINPNIGYNLNRGGNNKNTSEETKQLISKKAKERYRDKTKNPMYGKKHSKESLKKMSDAKIGENNPMFGKTQSEETKQKRRKTCAERHVNYAHELSPIEDKKRRERMHNLGVSHRKKIMCVEDDIAFDSIGDASKYYDVSISTLSGHLHGHQKTCKNKHFKFID